MAKDKLVSKHIKMGIMCLLFFFISLSGSLAEAAVFPEPSKDLYVYDETAYLKQATKEFIIAVNQEYETTLEKPQIAVVLVNSLEDLSVDEYAVGLFNKWGIGDESEDNGVLVLLAPDEGQVRIEVGYGLEDSLTDGLTGGILDSYLPLLKAKEFDQAISEIFTATVVTVNKKYGYTEFKTLSDYNIVSGDYQHIKEAKTRPVTVEKRTSSFSILAFLTEFGPFLLIALLSLFFGKSGGGSSGSGGSSYGGGSSGGSSSGGSSSGGGSSFGGGSSGGGGSSRSF